VAGEVTRMPSLAMKAYAVVLLRRRRAGCKRVGAERVVVHASRRANALPGGALGRLELFSELAPGRGAADVTEDQPRRRLLR
jgi:hypothetical protein